MHDAILNPFRHLPARPAKPPKDWALFLDLDGTLLDLAATPADVAIPPRLIADLERVADSLNGAVAIVSGRSLDDLDRLVGLPHRSAAAEHGAVMRFANGRCETSGVSYPDAWLASLRRDFDQIEGVVIETKAHGVAVHFRGAPTIADHVHAAITSLISSDSDRFELLPARMAYEFRARTATKGRAVSRFMREAPFRGRLPIFVGDDVTDDDGKHAAEALGGVGLKVDSAFAGQPSEVRRWLGALAAGGIERGG